MFPHVEGAIAIAEAILPGKPSRPGEIDPRWQAIILVGTFIESHPEVVCDFALRWAKRRGRDLAAAIHCCLIEHLLEHHFEIVFPMMRRASLDDLRVAEHFMPYSGHFQFGQATLPKNVSRLKRLARELERKHRLKRGATSRVGK